VCAVAILIWPIFIERSCDASPKAPYRLTGRAVGKTAGRRSLDRRRGVVGGPALHSAVQSIDLGEAFQPC